MDLTSNSFCQGLPVLGYKTLPGPENMATASSMKDGSLGVDGGLTLGGTSCCTKFFSMAGFSSRMLSFGAFGLMYDLDGPSTQ